MTESYVSIKDDAVKILNDNLLHIRKQFNVSSIGIFGSVARGEDTVESDIDILFSFQEGCVSFTSLLNLADYLESLFDRKVDLIPEDGLSQYMKSSVMNEVIWAHG